MPRSTSLDGPSVRTLHVNLDEAMNEDSDQQPDLRISGKSWSEFPELTIDAGHPEERPAPIGRVRAAFLLPCSVR